MNDRSNTRKLRGRRLAEASACSSEAPPANSKPPIGRTGRQIASSPHQPLMPLKLTVATSSRPQAGKPQAAMARTQIVLWALLLGLVQVAGQQPNSILQQYTRPSPVSQNLVNNMPQQAAAALYSNVNAPESLPLSRQSYGQPAADLDNVIESNTANSFLHQQPFAAPIVTRSIASQQSACQLPPTWAGKWYQANKEPIRVTNTEISDKGICRDKKGDKYLFEYTKQSHQPCLICLVINERHLNVLQYKESTCQPVPAHLNRTSNNQLILDNDHALLDSICSDITGDAQLESLFRLETPAIECPINGKYHFTYDYCQEPQSSLDSCIDKKQLNFKFSACPDTPGSESKSEVLKCYADWSEGNNYYMIGRLEHASNHQDKGKFRCFVYEKTPDGIHMAQSLEESCYGLINAHEGPKTLRLTARPPTSNKCHFPSFIRGQSENWLSVDNSLIYMFKQNSTKYQVMETKEGSVIEEATCLQQLPPPSLVHPHSVQSHQARSSVNQQVMAATNRRFPPSSNQYNQIEQSQQQHQAAFQSQKSNDAVYLVQITKNWRTSGIVQIDYFMALPGGDDQQRCRNAYTHSTPQTQIITSTNLEEQKCPFDGAYTIEAPPESDFTYNPSNIFMCPRQSFLTAQCDQPTRMRIHYKCSLAKHMVKNLKCLGSWTTNGLVRLLLADDEQHRYSAWYKDYALPAANSEETETTTPSQISMQTRAQQMLALSSSSPTNQQRNQLAMPLASVVDLQIALITPVQTVLKPMQVRLSRRSHCSDLRGYISQGSLSISQSSSIPSYAAPSASSSAHPSAMVLAAHGSGYSLALMVSSLFISLLFTTTSLAHSSRPRRMAV